MKQTGIKILLTGGHFLGAILPEDVVHSMIMDWMTKRLNEFHSATCQQTGSLLAFRVADVLAMHTFDPQQMQQQPAQQLKIRPNFMSN